MDYHIKQLTLSDVGSDEWKAFVELSVFYIHQYWPNAFLGKDLNDVSAEYEKMLLARIKQGIRGLFLVEKIDDKNREFIGLVNAYVEKSTLYIAEFFVKEQYRRKGIGKTMLDCVKLWGKTRGANEMKIKVDADLALANSFWRSFGLKESADADRNVYSIRIS